MEFLQWDSIIFIFDIIFIVDYINCVTIIFFLWLFSILIYLSIIKGILVGCILLSYKWWSYIFIFFNLVWLILWHWWNLRRSMKLVVLSILLMWRSHWNIFRNRLISNLKILSMVSNKIVIENMISILYNTLEDEIPFIRLSHYIIIVTKNILFFR